MRKLSLISGAALALVFLSVSLKTDSPHGADFKISCNVCHSSSGWKLDKTIYSFDHNTTKLPLVGQHQVTDCKQCHPTLVFSEAKTGCVDCHTDMHYQTVGPDCGRCHTPKSWIIENITEMHQRSRFPLVGAHYLTDCSNCHKSASLLRFDPLGVECVYCHQNDFNNATNPNHVSGKFSTNCLDCHKINSFTWTGSGFNHSVFPLTEGHAIECNRCHTNGVFTNLSTECSSCHMANYNATTNPNHAATNIPTTCADCHSTNPGWKPASFAIHDAQFFPIYSGKHNVGVWNSCADCHTNSGNYKTFTCIDCHAHNNQADVNSHHEGVSGYSYNSVACYECHPQGTVNGNFNHAAAGFSLTGGHSTVTCNSCHTNGFSGTSKECSSCHMNAYLQTTNPGHSAKGIPATCATCHTMIPGWKPASFPIHNNYFVLSGAHLTIVNNCAGCHHNNYNTTPNTCVGCHQADFNLTNNPNHAKINIPNNCSMCHTASPGWSPATFPIHNNYYVLQGAHAVIANNCNICHNNNYNSTPNTCVGCHLNDYNQTTNPPHASAGFPLDCSMCHTQTAWIPSTFNHDQQYFPIYSGHHNGTWSTCADCHTTPSNYALFSCIDCHAHNNKAEVDAAHSGVSGYSYNSVACYQCHPTGSGGGKSLIPKNLRKQN